jgi:GNAT superfamily N-acetyltransferase
VIASVRIRAADLNDVDHLAAVHHATVITAYAGMFPADCPPPTPDALRREWESDFSDPTLKAFVAEYDGGTVGTVAIRSDPEHPVLGELRRLHVLPRHWGKGIGAALEGAGVTALQKAGYMEAGIWVLEQNARARTFYERLGWCLVPGEILTLPGLDVLEVRYRKSVHGGTDRPGEVMPTQ